MIDLHSHILPTPEQMEAAGDADAAAAIRVEGLARYLTTEAPSATVAGERQPRRPSPQRRRLSFGRR